MTALERGDAWLRGHPWAADLVLAAGLAAVLGTSSAGLVLDGGPWAPALLAAVVLGHVLVAVRRVVPRAAFAATAALMLLLLAAPDLPITTAQGVADVAAPPVLVPSALVFLVQLYTVASRAPAPWPGLALAVGLVGAAATTVRLAVPGTWVGDTLGSFPAWWAAMLAALVAAVLAAWGLGRFRATRSAYVAALEERARRAEADRAAELERAAAAERERIAREMHDVVAHSLAVMVRQAEGGRRVAGTSPERAVTALETVAEAGRGALAEMRTALGALGAPSGGPPQPTVDDVPDLVDGMAATGMRVALDVTGEPVPVDGGVSLAAYRAVQESLTNVAKHVPDASVRVGLHWSPGTVRVEVVDDGGSSGRVGPTGPTGGGRGLVGMRERVTLLGGTFAAGPAEGGFAVRVELPVTQEVPG